MVLSEINRNLLNLLTIRRGEESHEQSIIMQLDQLLKPYSDPESTISIKDIMTSPLDDQGNTSLLIASKSDYRQNYSLSNKDTIIGKLLELGSNPNAQDDQGNTPLMSIIGRRDDVGAVKSLLEFGADPNLQNQKQHTVLMYASQFNRIKSIELLTENKVSTNQISSDGWTALKIAAFNGNTKAAELLIDGGADIDLGDPKLEISPLMFAVFHNKHETTKLLLKKGADPNKETIDGRTALSFAASQRNVEMIVLLLEHGSNLDQRDYEALKKIESKHPKIIKTLKERSQELKQDQASQSNPNQDPANMTAKQLQETFNRSLGWRTPE